MVQKIVVVTNINQRTLVVPSDYLSTNAIICIAGGGGGARRSNGGVGASGGGGGGVSVANNSLIAGATYTVQCGEGGQSTGGFANAPGGNGSQSWFRTDVTGSNQSAPTTTSEGVLANGGQGGPITDAVGAGGSTTGALGNIGTFAGGNGAAAVGVTDSGGGGGGSSASRTANGFAGGSLSTNGAGDGGSGGAGTGADGGTTSTATGGTGGASLFLNNASGGNGGAGSSTSTAAGNGTNGGSGNLYPYVRNDTQWTFGNIGLGAGGGGGGGNSSTGNGGAGGQGGLYGGGGGGGGGGTNTGVGNIGGSGAIILIYEATETKFYPTTINYFRSLDPSGYGTVTYRAETGGTTPSGTYTSPTVSDLQYTYAVFAHKAQEAHTAFIGNNFFSVNIASVTNIGAFFGFSTLYRIPAGDATFDNATVLASTPLDISSGPGTRTNRFEGTQEYSIAAGDHILWVIQAQGNAPGASFSITLGASTYFNLGESWAPATYSDAGGPMFMLF